MSGTQPIIGFVGSGRIGAPMIERLLLSGHEVRLFARRPETRERLAASGALLVDDVRDAACDADISFVCVYSDDQLRDVAGGPHGLISAMRSGSVLASHVTGSPSTILELAQIARTRGAEIVDAPFSGSDHDIRAGRLTVMLGGSDDATARVGDVVAAYAGTILRIGPLATALQVKLLNNLVFAANIQTTLEAISVGRELGLAIDAMTRAFAASSAGSYVVDGLVKASSPESFADNVAPFLRKDLAALASSASELEVDVAQLMRTATTGPLDLSTTGAVA